MSQVILITGGVRSGKSAFTERLARDWLAQHPAPDTQRPLTYVATSRVWDGEMAARVARHQADRPAEWRTLEAPMDLVASVEQADPASVVLVESIDAWVSNRLLDASPVTPSDGTQLDRAAIAALEDALLREARALLAARQHATAPLLLVTLEAGMGVVPPSPLGRAFRDLLGRVNATLAAGADAVYLLVAGLPVDVKRLSASYGALGGSL